MLAPACDLDFYGDAALRDPVPLYHAMLATAPVVWLPQNNIHAIVGYDALTTVLRKPLIFQSGRGVSWDDDVNPRLVGSTLNSDPPDHDISRAITGAPLTPKALLSVRERIHSEAQAVVDDMMRRKRFDAAKDMAPRLPLAVVRDLVGLSEDAKAKMLTWAAATFELMGDCKDRRPKALHDLGEMRAYLAQHGQREKLAPGGWARRIFDLGPDAGIAADRCAELMRDYINPSLDTTISAIGFGIKLFADHPDQWDALRADPSLLKNAIEEIVRLNTPIRGFTRYVAEDFEVGDVMLVKGSRVLVVWGAANRDFTKFENPDRFDITRNTRGHLGFGYGVHACMGMHLARLEMAELFGALLTRVRRFRLTGDCISAANATIRAYAAVPVEVDLDP